MRACLFAGLVTVLSGAVLAASFDVTAYGAKGDGRTVDTAAIQAAVDAAAQAGGGRVVVPRGTFVSGTVWLKSHVELHLAAGAVLKGSIRQADYNANDAFPENFWSKDEQWSGGHLVCGYKVEDVAITADGEGAERGTIDGSGPAFFSPYPDVDSYFPSYRYGCKEHPLDRTWFRPGPMVAFFLSKGIRLEGVRLAFTPCWTLHIRCSSDVTIRRVDVAADRTVGNSDGFSIDCTRNVTIEDCTLATGDDGIAIRASCKLHAAEHPTEHVRVRRCTVRSCACGVRVGVGSGTIRDVVIADSVFPETSRGLSFQPAWRKQGKNVYISDVTVTNCAFYEQSLPVRVFMPDGDSRVENVLVKDCVFEALEPNQVISKGHPQAIVRNVRFENCTHRPIERLRVCHNYLWMTYWEKKHREQEGQFLIAGCESNNVTAVNCRLLPKVEVSTSQGLPTD